MLARQNDALAKTVKSLSEGQTENALEKRARSDFKNVAVTEAVDMLKAAGEVGEDTPTGKSILKALGAMNKVSDGLFKSLGSTEVPELGENIDKDRKSTRLNSSH